MRRGKGEADADAFLESLTSDQVAELLAFEELEPQGPNRDDLRIARLACVIVNSIPFRGKDAPALKEEDVFATLRRDPLAPGQVMSSREIGAEFRKLGAKRVSRGADGKAKVESPATPKPSKKPGKKPKGRGGKA